MITKHSKIETKLAEEYDINLEKCVFNSDDTNGIIVMQELDYELDGKITDENMKKLIAFKILKSKLLQGSYGRAIIGELDYSVHTDGEGTIYTKVDNYAASNKQTLKQLFRLLENRSIDKNSKMIDILNYSYKPLEFLNEFGYTCYAQENSVVSAWAKNKLKKHEFNSTIHDLNAQLKNQSESQR